MHALTRRRVVTTLAIGIAFIATGCTPALMNDVDNARSAAAAPTLARSTVLGNDAAARAQAVCSSGQVLPSPVGSYQETPAEVHELVATAPLDPSISDATQRNIAATGKIWDQWKADPELSGARFTAQGAGEATCANGTLAMTEVLTAPAPTARTGRYATAQYDPSTVVETANQEYGTAVDVSGNTVSLLADVYTPPAGAPAPRPTVILIHGGAFTGGSRTDYTSVARKWASYGYEAVAIDYRLDPNLIDHFTTQEQATAVADAILDAEEAIRWVKSNASTYGVDTSKVIAVGDSAGGAIALGTSAAPDISSTGPLAAYSSSVVAAVSTGAYLTPALDSGALHPGAGLAPILMFHYETDVASNTGAYAFRWCAAYRQGGSVCDYVSQPGEGHTTDLTPGGTWWTSQIEPFVFRWLGLG
jgi:dienelactone hydrolase